MTTPPTTVRLTEEEKKYLDRVYGSVTEGIRTLVRADRLEPGETPRYAAILEARDVLDSALAKSAREVHATGALADALDTLYGHSSRPTLDETNTAVIHQSERAGVEPSELLAALDAYHPEEHADEMAAADEAWREVVA